MTKQEFSLIAASLPAKPGIYKYYDINDQIIYVGKAKNIRKRVHSYFSKISDQFKTQKLVSEIVKLEYAIVDSEQDAFLLENTLIKQYQPKYNMMLKDDKSYPHIVIKNEAFPRIFLTRRKIKDGSEYLGPYTSIDQVRSILDFIKQTLPFRSCNLKLTQDNITKGKFKPCLEYHIGNCKAPCVGLQTTEEYAWQVQQVREILKGKLGEITKHYKQEMMQFAASMQFEKAAIVKKKIEFISQYQSKTVVVSTQLDNTDICSLLSNTEAAFINYMVIVQGSIIHTHTITIEKKLDETDEEVMQFALIGLREKFNSHSREIIVPFAISFAPDIRITVPKSGDKKKLLDLSFQNAQYALQDYKRKKTLLLEANSEGQNIELLTQLQTDLHLKSLPIHIECFDNSNFQGSYPVAAMVCFKNGLPDKKEYRHFHIKTVEGINDFASMQEIVYRRYKRVLDEQKSLPQLIVIDGGKGQLSAAMESIKALNLLGKTTVVGLAKNVEEIFYPGDHESLKLSFQSETLNLLKRIRDEVHRFGITFHRNTRSKGVIKNELQQIEGIGEKTAQDLLKIFKSVASIKRSALEDIEKAIGKSKAKLVKDYFEGKSQTSVH